jgi:hypothetical protein
MKTKRLALLLSVIFVFGLFLAACDDTSPDVSPTDGNGGPDPGKTGNEVGPVPDGAIDFADGNFGFVMINQAPADADPSEVSVVDFNDGKALRIVPTEGMVPYVGIDVSSLYGSRVADVRKIEMRLWTQHASGTFYPVSGMLEIFTGEENRKTDIPWGVSMERNNPRVFTADVPAGLAFAAGAQNIIQLRKSDDRSPDNKTVIIIDYIAGYDASGNIIPADTTVDFDQPEGFGLGDITFLYATRGDVVLSFMDDGRNGTGSNWGQAATLNVFVDEVARQDVLDALVPGAVITVSYESEVAPELIFQSWDGGAGWAKIEPFAVNASGTTIQYLFEDIVEAYGDDFSVLNRIHVGARAPAITVTAFLIGQRVGDPPPVRPMKAGHSANGIAFSEIIGSGEFDGDGTFTSIVTGVEDDGFNPEWITAGGWITVLYNGDVPEIFLIHADGSEAGIGASAAGVIHDTEMGIIQFPTDALLSVWQGDLEEDLSAFRVTGGGIAHIIIEHDE